MKSIWTLFLKDLSIERRAWSRTLALVSFAVLTLLLFSFAVGPNTEVLRQHASGYLWLGGLFVSSSLFAASFRVETEGAAVEQLLLAPVSTQAIFYAKALANTLQLILLLCFMFPFLVAICDISPVEPLYWMGVVFVLGAMGLAAPGALYAAMTAKLSEQQLLMPILLYPLVIPALLSAVKATSLIFTGDPMDQMTSWLSLLAAFDVVYWSLCGILFGHLVD